MVVLPQARIAARPIHAIKEYRSGVEVIIVTGYGTMESAIEAMKYGSYDYIQKPFKLDHLKMLIDRIVEEKKLKIDYITRKRRIRERYRYRDMVGISLAMQDVYETVERIRDGGQTVLLLGESGVGKQLAARTIHDAGFRKEKSFLAVNCAAMPAGKPEDEIDAYVGDLIEKAAGGTLYLDEITDLRKGSPLLSRTTPAPTCESCRTGGHHGRRGRTRRRRPSRRAGHLRQSPRPRPAIRSFSQKTGLEYGGAFSRPFFRLCAGFGETRHRTDCRHRHRPVALFRNLRHPGAGVSAPGARTVRSGRGRGQKGVFPRPDRRPAQVRLRGLPERGGDGARRNPLFPAPCGKMGPPPPGT